MPSKNKAAPKASAESKAVEPPPASVAEQTLQRYYATNPLSKRKESAGYASLTPAEKKTYAYVNSVSLVSEHAFPLSNKAEREYWKTVTKEGLPVRRLTKDYNWGTDKNSRAIDSYTPEEYKARSLKQARLSALGILSQAFSTRRELLRSQGQDVDSEQVEEEKKRRKAMADLNKELYGEFDGPLAQDPLWDDVIPIPQNEPEGALAQIAYPEYYAEAVSYLRAVMAAEECSHRALRLTEHVISMNPAHYTVWLYRFKVLSSLQIPVPEEIEWLNEVSLANLKNYQIWHHRHLLMDYYYPQVADDHDAVKKLQRSESAFIKQMLEEDTKNYHVWSYRKYLVGKLGMWNVQEMGATQNMIEEDVRNNSAWAHRFFLVFSNPKHATPGSLPTQSDPGIPAESIDREVNFSKQKIRLAPQNQAAWNYLRGVLTKSERGLGSVADFAEEFVQELGKGDQERVTSSHALDMIADISKEKSDAERAKLCLERLRDKWDPMRAGYWTYRISQLG